MMKQKWIRKDGFTIVEFIVAMSVMAIFFLGVTMILSAGSQMYIKGTIAGNSDETIATIIDDIQNYVMYGEEARVFYRLEDGEDQIAGKSVQNANPDWFTAGTEVYLDPDDPNHLIFEDPVGAKNAVTLPNTGGGGADPLISKDFYGNGIDLGYKKIYLVRERLSSGNYVGKSVKGLSFGTDYYRGMELNLKFTDKAIEEEDITKKGIYGIELTGYGKMLMSSSNVSVNGLNEK